MRQRDIRGEREAKGASARAREIVWSISESEANIQWESAGLSPP